MLAGRDPKWVNECAEAQPMWVSATIDMRALCEDGIQTGVPRSPCAQSPGKAFGRGGSVSTDLRQEYPPVGNLQAVRATEKAQAEWEGVGGARALKAKCNRTSAGLEVGRYLTRPTP